MSISFSSLDDEQLNDNGTIEFVIEYKASTIYHSVYYQHFQHLIRSIDAIDIKAHPHFKKTYPHCQIVFKSYSDQLYVLTHLLFEKRIVYKESSNHTHKIINYEDNKLQAGQEGIDYEIKERNGISYYSHFEYDKQYLKLFKIDPLLSCSFEFGMSLLEICTQVLYEYNINISTSIKANVLPQRYYIVQQIINNVRGVLKQRGRRRMIPDIFTEEFIINNSNTCLAAKGFVNSCINQCDFESFNDHDVMILLNCTHSIKGEIKRNLDVILKKLPNRPVKLLAMYKTALISRGWSEIYVNKFFYYVSKMKNLNGFKCKYKKANIRTKSTLCKYWLDDNKCKFSKFKCDYAHGLEQVQFKCDIDYIIEAIYDAMEIDFSSQYRQDKSKQRAKQNEAKDIRICDDYEGKITNIKKYVTEEALKQRKNLLQSWIIEIDLILPDDILTIIWRTYLGYPGDIWWNLPEHCYYKKLCINCTPDQYYYCDGERPKICRKERSFIDNKGYWVGVEKNTYMNLKNKNYNVKCRGPGIFRVWGCVILPPGISLTNTIGGMLMTEKQFIHALNTSVDIVINENNNNILNANANTNYNNNYHAQPNANNTNNKAPGQYGQYGYKVKVNYAAINFYLTNTTAPTTIVPTSTAPTATAPSDYDESDGSIGSGLSAEETSNEMVKKFEKNYSLKSNSKKGKKFKGNCKNFIYKKNKYSKFNSQ